MFQNIISLLLWTFHYTNINHWEGAETYFKKVEERENKSNPSTVIKTLIPMTLRSNTFRFGSDDCGKLIGKMGTPMAQNYATLFMDNFEQNLLQNYFQKTGLLPLVWFLFIDNIFFNKELLDHFISFTQN